MSNISRVPAFITFFGKSYYHCIWLHSVTYPLRLCIFLNKGSPHLRSKSITICTCAGNQYLKLNVPRAWPWKWRKSVPKWWFMEIVSSLSLAAIARLVSERMHCPTVSLRRTVIVPNRKFLFTQFKILLTFFTQWVFEYPIKWKMCAYATQWVKTLTRVLIHISRFGDKEDWPLIGPILGTVTLLAPILVCVRGPT